MIVGPRGGAAHAAVTVRSARLHRAGTRVNRVKLRYRSEPLRAGVIGDPPAGRHAT